MSPAFRRGTEPTDKGIGVHRHLLHHRRDSKLGQVSCCRGGVRALARPSMARRAREDVCEAVDVPGMARRVWSGRAGGEWCVMKERLRDVSHARFACAALLSRGRWPRREPRAAERTAPSARAPCRSRPAPAPRWSCSRPPSPRRAAPQPRASPSEGRPAATPHRDRRTRRGSKLPAGPPRRSAPHHQPPIGAEWPCDLPAVNSRIYFIFLEKNHLLLVNLKVADKRNIVYNRLTNSTS